MRANQNNTVFVMIDIQEKFIPVISDKDKIVKNSNILNKAAEILNIPLIVTEQYPQGLGRTMQEINIPAHAEFFEKYCFTVFNDEISKRINELSKPLMVLYGIESHICMMQSALDGLRNGYHVVIVVDAISSRKPESKEIALRRFENEGVTLVSTEMLLFEILGTAKHPNFKEISALVK